MRKIRKFKIPVYSHEVQRKAKKGRIDLFSIGLAATEHLKEFSVSLFHACEPATVFDHFRAELPEMKETPPGETRGVITLGPGLAAKAAALQGDNARLAEIAAEVFLDTGLKVITELAAQEASNEGFDLGESSLLAGPGLDCDIQAISELLRPLEAVKIGVSVEEGVITPRHTIVFSIPWLARKKKEKKAAAQAAKPGEKK